MCGWHSTLVGLPVPARANCDRRAADGVEEEERWRQKGIKHGAKGKISRSIIWTLIYCTWKYLLKQRKRECQKLAHSCIVDRVPKRREEALILEISLKNYDKFEDFIFIFKNENKADEGVNFQDWNGV